MNLINSESGGRATRFGLPLWFSYVACLLFGTAILLNTHPTGDGAWFWYARLMLQGRHIYSGMHLALQPFYILEIALTQKLFGLGWLVGKLPGLVHLVFYLFAISLLVRRTGWSEWDCAILLASIFGLSIQFEALRFDDYHIPVDVCILLSVNLLLELPAVGTARQAFRITALLGLLSGLAIVTRVNDGVLLLLVVALAVILNTPARWLLQLGTVLVAASITVLMTVLATGDTPHAWLTNSILHAAESKGGLVQVLKDPIHLPYSAIYFLVSSRENATGLLYTALLAVVIVWLLNGLFSPAGKQQWKWKAFAAGALLLSAHHLIAFHLQGKLTTTISAVIVLITFPLLLLVLWRITQSLLQRRAWDKSVLVLLVPAGQLVSGSMSSGGSFIPLYTPIAIEFLLWAVLFGRSWRSKSVARNAFLVIAVLASFWIVPFKYRLPFTWHTYLDQPMFKDRVWYRHPVYGPMLIQRENLAFMQSACNTIRSSGSPDLLSMPYPYINYFCDIPPWHGYVQTFFDTSGSVVILPLVRELETSPPEWIVYQRQPQVLHMHEIIYNNWRPLPHRKIDELLVNRVLTGQWKVTQQGPLGVGAQWYLLHTR